MRHQSCIAKKPTLKHVNQKLRGFLTKVNKKYRDRDGRSPQGSLCAVGCESEERDLQDKYTNSLIYTYTFI